MHVSSLLILLAALFCQTAQAQTAAEPATEPGMTTLDARKESHLTIVGSYALYSFLVSGKRGAEIGYHANENWTFQLDYLKGDYGLENYGLNLLTFEEQLILAEARAYFNGTFNLVFGLGERKYKLEFGERILKHIDEEERSSLDVLTVKTYVVDFGVGNRWQWMNGITLGADWFTIQYPVGPRRISSDVIDEIDDEKTKRNVKRFVGVLGYMPTVTLAKISFGYTF